MKNSNEVAIAIKDYLIDLAINDKLPLDMTQLDVSALEDVINNISENDTPIERDLWVEKARAYLRSDTDEEIIEMVIAIYNQSLIDGSLDIDYVDGVVVFDYIQYSFTCNGFLYSIGYNME